MNLRINVKAPVSHNTILTAKELENIRTDLEPLLAEGNVSNLPAPKKWLLLEDLAYRVQPVFLENMSDKMNISQVFFILDAHKRGKKVGSPDATIRVLRNVIEDLTPLPCGKWKRVRTRRNATNNSRTIREANMGNAKNEWEHQWFGSECAGGRPTVPNTRRRKTRKV